MQIQKCESFISNIWDNSILPCLTDYIRIPNKSPLFDPEWQANGHMDKAVKLITEWCEQNAIENMIMEVIRHEGRTPVIFIEIPGNSNDTIMLYGHLDKQPEMKGWDADLGPWNPVIKNNKLYGRGGADDGYAVFASLAAIKALHDQQMPHARCVIIIEASEESGSPDLPYYMQTLEKRIGNPNLIICLDSGCGNYDQLWMTTSLRGLFSGILHIDVLKEGVHSGLASGIVPSCFLILRQLLDRIEDANTGNIILSDFHVDIPETRLKQLHETADVLGEQIFASFPRYKNIKALSITPKEQLINRTWKPALSVVGMDGLPATHDAGNVTLPSLSVKLSMRLPPTTDAKQAALQLKKYLEQNPPFDSNVRFDIAEAGSGWNAPVEEEWLHKAAQRASENYFGKNAMYMGEGCSIPFMGMLGKKYPDAQFMITGLLGPESNAHGPNEFLHIPAAKKLTCCVAQVIAEHYHKI